MTEPPCDKEIVQRVATAKNALEPSIDGLITKIYLNDCLIEREERMAPGARPIPAN